MSTPTLFIRTAVASDGSFEPLFLAVALDAWLRRVDPRIRVTTFAEGSHRAQDFLYPRVRDLVSLKPGTLPADEAWAISTRGRADLVIHDAGPFREESSELWRRVAPAGIVRAERPRLDFDGRPLVGWSWSSGDVSPELVALRGFAAVLQDPLAAKARRDAVPFGRHVVVLVDGAADLSLLALLLEDVALVRGGIDHVVLRVNTPLTPAKRATLVAACPELGVVAGDDPVKDVLSTADFVIAVGVEKALLAAAAGVPALVLSAGADDLEITPRVAASLGQRFAGTLAGLGGGSVARHLDELVRLPGDARASAARARAVVDGRGFERAIRELVPGLLPSAIPAEIESFLPRSAALESLPTP